MNVINYHIIQHSLFKDRDKSLSELKDSISSEELAKTGLESHNRNSWSQRHFRI